MSFKGFQKSVIRAPQVFKQRFNLGEQTKDPIFIDAERRFQELEEQTKRLHEESRKYTNAVNGMLTHQINFSQAIAEIYKPISGRVSDPDSIISEGNPEGIQACEEYEAIVKELQVTLEPELQMIETRIVHPAEELLIVVKQIRKGVLKREHKQLDVDRHRATLKKLQDKKDKSMKDEKAMYKAENEVEQATQEFNYFNDLLKEELPKLFRLEREFIIPLFQSFYYMQLNVFYTLHERMQGCDIGYFNLTLGIEEAFEAKRGEIQQAAEALAITKFRTRGAKRPPKYGPGAAAGRLGIESGTSQLAIEDKPGSSSASPRRRATSPGRTRASFSDIPPPAYNTVGPSSSLARGRAAQSGVGRANSTGGNWGAAAKAKGAAPPPPKPKPSRFSGVPVAETVTALYDYEAQAEGDLSFATGDVIEIIHRTQNDNEWWTGRVGSKEGQFPDMSSAHGIHRPEPPSSLLTGRSRPNPLPLFPVYNLLETPPLTDR
ncbi:hypothetical protein VE04_08116 [Pseudogymnoascus sp. 24MN13]|nr:hypothetical protein VE04_08116 [Pseudogymnoascus sp. 24MN13]